MLQEVKPPLKLVNGHLHGALPPVVTVHPGQAAAANTARERIETSLQAAWQAGETAGERTGYRAGWRFGMGLGVLYGLLAASVAIALMLSFLP